MKGHGTTAMYSHGGCRCDPCRAAESAMRRQRRRKIAYDQWKPYEDAAPARDHVRWLQAQKIPWPAVAARAGVPRDTVNSLLYGRGGKPPTMRIRPATAAALLAVRPDPGMIPPAVSVDATGCRRRLQALIAIGHTTPRLADRLGRNTDHLHHVVSGKAPRVSTATDAAVRVLYDEWWDKPPAGGSPWARSAASQARVRAAREGWPPPAAWDDSPGPHCIDTPKARPAPGWKRQETGR